MIKLADPAIITAIDFLKENFDTIYDISVADLIEKEFNCKIIDNSFPTKLLFNTPADETTFILRFS
ncbi:MAG: hypothetical protein RLY43_388 [Bacteroidota bacterium]|jgi:hypothetical protein